MVGFRNAAGSSEVDQWWSDGRDQIAFAREGRAFIAINNDDEKEMKVTLQTSLPPGQYLDVISGDTVLVQRDGRTEIQINPDTPVPVVAIHVNAKKL